MKIKLSELRNIIQHEISESYYASEDIEDIEGALSVIHTAKEKFRASIDVLDDIFLENDSDKMRWLNGLKQRLLAFVEPYGEFHMGFEGLSIIGDTDSVSYFKQLKELGKQVSLLDVNIAKDYRQMLKLKVAVDSLLGSIVILFSRALKAKADDWEQSGFGPMKSYEEDAAELYDFWTKSSAREPETSTEMSPELQALQNKLDQLKDLLSKLPKKGPFKN